MGGNGLQFGIYPLSVAGTPTGLASGPADDYPKVQRALKDLGGPESAVLPRTYLIYTGPGSESTTRAVAQRYADNGLLGHWTMGCLQEGRFDLDAWVNVVRAVVAEFGSRLASLQITNEPNLSFMEGSKPYVTDALVHGVIAAKDEADDLGLDLPVGFGSVPDSPAAVRGFWTALAAAGGKALVDATDFVGHNFYVDVFEDPVEIADIPARVERTLTNLRTTSLSLAGIPTTTPIRIAENGWPTGRNPLTGATRPYERQSEVFETVIRTVHLLRTSLNISHYMLFGLRDADSANDEIFHQFGILRDDYTSKPAYETFKALVRELGSQPGPQTDDTTQA